MFVAVLSQSLAYGSAFLVAVVGSPHRRVSCEHLCVAVMRCAYSAILFGLNVPEQFVVSSDAAILCGHNLVEVLSVVGVELVHGVVVACGFVFVLIKILCLMASSCAIL